MPSPSQLGALTQYLTRFSGPAVRGRVFSPREMDELEVALRRLPGSGTLDLIREASAKPDVNTHLLYDLKSQPRAIFQLAPPADTGFGTFYMPNLLSLFSGGGLQALQEASRFGPYSLVSTPDSRAFYEKAIQRIPGFIPHPDPDLRGIAYGYREKNGPF